MRDDVLVDYGIIRIHFASFALLPPQQYADTIFFYTGGNKDIAFACDKDTIYLNPSTENIEIYYNSSCDHYLTHQLNEDLVEFPQGDSFYNYTGSDYYDPKEDPYSFVYILTLILGIWLLGIIIVDLGLVFVPIASLPAPIANLVRPSGINAEAKQKKAAFYKVSNLVRRSLKIQERVDVSTRFSSSLSLKGVDSNRTKGILIYQTSTVETEGAGGIVWTWRKLIDGTLQSEEGVWIHRYGPASIVVLVERECLTTDWPSSPLAQPSSRYHNGSAFRGTYFAFG